MKKRAKLKGSERSEPNWVSYLYNEAPATCWGSPEKVEAWLRPATPTQETKS